MLTNALGTQYDGAGNPVSGEVGTTAPTAAVQVGGVGSGDGNLHALLTDNTGHLLVTFTAADTTAAGTLNALNTAVTITMAGQVGASFVLTAGTLVGTIVPETSYDNTNWSASYFIDPTTNLQQSSIVFGANNTLTTKTVYTPNGAGFARVRVSAFTSGTAAATMRASAVNAPDNLSAGPSGSTVPAISTAIGGLNAGNLITIAVDASGRTISVGAAATGGAPSGNPVYVAGLGTDANLHALSTDASGRQIVVGSTAAGAALSGNAVPTGGVTSAGNFEPFLVDSFGRLLVIEEKAGTSAITRVATSNASAPLLASNANRLGAVIVNESSHKMYLKFGATASATSYTALMAANAYYEVPFDYTGAIDAILDAGSGNAQITELTN